ncbi:MAG: DUF2357 domain-containing protein [Cryomorphaceae bacterium]|nr:DUF2357 domain-containing protein [Cryomorphaceae bacterium]
MQTKTSEIKIPLLSRPDIHLCIYGNKVDTLKVLGQELAAERGESPWQLLEGCFYNYYFEKEGQSFNDFQIEENVVVKNSLRKGVSEGRISPNIYVGSLEINIVNKSTKDHVETIYVEVLPTKLDATEERKEDSSYIANYEFMLDEIAEKSTVLLLQIESPVYQNFEVDFNSDPKTIYQRFAFVKSLLNNEEFWESIQKIISAPTSRWNTESEQMDVQKVRRINSKTVRQLTSGSNRVKFNRQNTSLDSVPQKIVASRKVETFDTHENRFIKYALHVFLQFIRECEHVFSKHKYEKSRKEASSMAALLENQIHHPFFTDILKPTVLKLNSPALQRKSGYREILNAWLRFDLSLRLIWRGGDDVYKAGKRDIAVLYEYWLFFKLYDLMVSKFKLSEIIHEDSETKEVNKHEHLIDTTKDGVQLIVKSGSFTALECVYNDSGWAFNVRFSYNKTFSGKTVYSANKEGSWTKPLRPDYTLSIWPKTLTSEEAEAKEQMVHIHFDSKYKVQHFTIPETVDEIEDTDDLDDTTKKIDSLVLEKRNELKGVYKNADLMKMHAYKDAIRRTAGAYILYPGTEIQKPLSGFHEIIPGLGAFPVRPQKGDTGISELSKFIDEVIANFKFSASQKRKYALKTYETFKGKPPTVSEDYPLPYNLIPDEIYVLVGFYKSKEHLEWIKTNKLYNFRMDRSRGALILNKEALSAKYLLLHTFGDNNSKILLKIGGDGFRVTSKETLKRLGYPSSPSQENYLVVKIEHSEVPGFGNMSWDFKRLKGYKRSQNSAFPFTVSLADLMKSGRVEKD